MNNLIYIFSSIIIILLIVFVLLKLRKISYLNNLINKLNNDIENKNKEINNLNDDLEDKNKKIYYLNEDLEDLEEERNKNKKNIRELNNQIAQLDLNIKNANDVIEKKERELDDLKDELIEEKNQKENIENIFRAILSILNSKLEEDKNLLEFRKIITDKDYKGMNLLFSELKKIENELSEIVKNPYIYTFSIVSIGGAFSSGKSSFINTLFDNGNNFTLPTGDVPVTSIPAYIINNEESYIECLTLDNKKSKLDKSIFDFISVKNSISENTETNINPKSIIKHFYVNSKLKEHVKNICFIDTPGYNPPNESKEDREISKKYISNTNTLIWIINISEGTITKDGIVFLKEILLKNPKIQIYIIVNYADIKHPNEIKEICDNIYLELEKNKINFVGISPYTSHYNKSEYNNYYYNNFKYGMSFLNFLKNLNKKNNEKYESIKNTIDNIFINYREYFQNKINTLNNYKKDISTINNKYISNMAYVKSLVYKYISLVHYEYLKKDEDLENNIGKNTKNINININNIKNNLEKHINEYELYINNSYKIYYDILKYINNIFYIKS